jgi:hypothetical protein
LHSSKHLCLCGEVIAPRRFEAGYTVCLSCGEREARQRKFTVVPFHKSNYQLVTDRSLLFQLNKGGQ